ncbi:type VI secretion system tube protein TssD, partial [Pseudomonas cerasi]
MNVRLTFIEYLPLDSSKKFYSISIEGGVITDLTLDMPHVILQNDAEPQEHLAIRYRSITWAHHLAGTTGYSAWGGD